MLMIFTEEQANSALILVQPIVLDILEKQLEIKDILEQTVMNQVQKTEVKRLQRELWYHFKELESIGCIVKNRETGEIAFPINDFKLSSYLSWKPEEPSVSLVQREGNTVVYIRPYAI